MSFDPALSTAKDRIRADIGDTGSAPAPGGVGVEWLTDQTIVALLSLAGGDEERAMRRAAGVLYSTLAMQPVKRTGPSGEAVDYTARIAALKALADGSAPAGATAPSTASPGLEAGRINLDYQETYPDAAG